MYPKKSRSLVASAVSLALSSTMLSPSLNAAQVVGAIDVSGAYDKLTTGALSWNQANVSVFKVVDGVEVLEPFAKTSDTDALEVYDPVNMLVTAAGDSFVSKVYGDGGVQMARVSGKVWPVGGPTGIKAVRGDNTKNGKPQNCLINTSFLGEDPAVVGDADQYLDSAAPAPVICSSFFQSHKRFKIAMLPGTVDGVADGAASTKPIDLVFNVDSTGHDANGNPIPYQVFSKINNYTGKFLKGYRVVVGKGTGTNFKSASELGIADQLYISLGVGEGATSAGEPDGSDLFDPIEGLATFSRGLFGPHDEKIYVPPRFPTDGFFDVDTAGFEVSQACASAGCVDAPNVTGIDGHDEIFSGNALPSFYSEYFGQWLHSGVAPKGLYRFEGANVDATLIAWWDGQKWVKPYEALPLPGGDGSRPNPGQFVTVSDAELQAMAADSRYTVDVIEDTLNLGINYIVKLGQVVQTGVDDPTGLLDDANFTIRIIPVVGDQTQATPWTARVPTNGDLTYPTTLDPVPYSGDGGCTVGSSGRFDPTLPALLAMGLGFFGWRRFKSGK